MAKSPDPKRRDLLHGMDKAEAGLTSMISRWFDSIPAHVRMELHAVREPLERLLIRAGLRPGPPLE